MYFNDHDPPHVHALKAGGQAKIELSSLGDSSLLLVQGMSAKDAKTAIAIVTASSRTLSKMRGILWLTP